MVNKACKTVLIVDSVEKAVKFYTEKLTFDIVELKANKEDNNQIISFALLKKFKFFLILRTPKVEELAEFSFIKRCTSRGVGIFIIIKKGLDKFYSRCTKKGVHIITEPKESTESGYKIFSVKDPYGIKLTFGQPIEGFKKEYKEFCGLSLSKTDGTGRTKKESEILEEMVKHLKGYGILRRFAKKFAKRWLKNK